MDDKLSNSVSKNVAAALDWVQPQAVRRMSVRASLKRMRPADYAKLIAELPEMIEAQETIRTLEQQVATLIAQLDEKDAGFAYAMLRLMGPKASLNALRAFQEKDLVDAGAKVEKAKAELKSRRKSARGAQALKALLDDPEAALDALVEDEE